MQRSELEILLEKFINGELSDTGKRAFSEMLVSPEYRGELERLIDKGFADPDLAGLGDPETRELIYQQILLQKDGLLLQSQKETPLTPLTPLVQLSPARRQWWLGAAASIILLLGAGTWFLFLKRPEQQIARLPPQQERFHNDIAPGGNKAILTLGNGSTIILDSAHNGTLSQQGGSNVIKRTDGELAYAPTGSGKHLPSTPGKHEVVYNMISTPRGGQYKLSLPDGSSIWLNAASSIRYPTEFSGKERQVEIRGEAYFDIAPDASKPFTVLVNGMKVDVLGTQFNINAYNDEAVIKTTLLKGSVRVTAGKATTLLTPGDQAQVNSGPGSTKSGGPGSIKLIKASDTDEAVAWMHGVFKFNQVTIGPLMSAIARWYDVDLNYEGKITSHFILTIPRNVTVANVLKILEQTGEVHFKIDGRQVTVMH